MTDQASPLLSVTGGLVGIVSVKQSPAPHRDDTSMDGVIVFVSITIIVGPSVFGRPGSGLSELPSPEVNVMASVVVAGLGW